MKHEHDSRIDPELRKEMERDRALTEHSTGPAVYKVPEDGEPHRIRVLPGTFGRSGKKFYALQLQHWAPKGNKRVPFDCPKQVDENEDCPFCDALEGHRKAEDKLRKELKATSDVKKRKKIKQDLDRVGKIIRQCLTRSSYALNIVSREDRDPTPKVMYAPISVFQEFEKHFLNDGDVILDVDNGHDFNVTRTRKNNRTTYTAQIVIRASPLADTAEEIDRILADAHDLDSLVQIPDFDDLEDAYLDMLDRIDDDDDDGGPIRSSKKVHRRDDDDDEAPPARRSSRRDDDDDGDDEAPPPARRERSDRPARPSRTVSRRAEAEDDPEPRRKSEEPRRKSEAEDDPEPRRNPEDLSDAAKATLRMLQEQQEEEED